MSTGYKIAGQERVYDPQLARFLSPDPMFQSPNYSQNFNKYSYVLNNPFKYTDPSGYYIQGYKNELYQSVGSRALAAAFAKPDFSTLYAGANAYFRSSYHYDKSSSTGYRNGLGEEVTFDEVNQNYIAPRAEEGTYTLSIFQGYGEYTSDETGIYASPTSSLAIYRNFEFTSEPRKLQQAQSGGANLQDDTGTPVQTASNVNNYAGIVFSAAAGTVQNTRVGANFAYAISGNSRLVSGVANGLEAAPYVGLLLTTGTGYYLSTHVDPATNQPYQSWAETGTDIGANLGTIYLGTQFGGWIGAGAATLYIGDKAAFKWYMNTVSEHPEYVLPSSVHSFTH